MRIAKNNFEGVGNVATHCDLPKLRIAIDESEIFDVAKLFCSDWGAVLEIIDEVDNYLQCLKEEENECVKPEFYEQKYALVYGGNYASCGGSLMTQLGVKRLWVYYAYSRYLLLNMFNDTPNGTVKKTNEFSIPTPLKEIEMFADKYRTMAYDTFKGISDFICKNNSIFNFSEFDCKSCTCAKCKKGTMAKGYGFLGSNITKKI